MISLMTTRLSRDAEPLRPLQAVTLCVLVGVAGGGMLLLSAARPTAPVDGAIEWHEGSPLHAVVELLCLNHQAPTLYAGAVKNYLLGLGAGLTAVALAVALLAGGRGGRHDADDPPSEEPPVETVEEPAWEHGRHHTAPLRTARILCVLYLLWSFASMRWSAAPQIALGASLLLGIEFLWAFALSLTLTVRAAHLASRIVLAVLGVTAGVAIWYHYGRNPTLRADFPVGNPVFLATCLIPGITLALSLLFEGLTAYRASRSGKHLAVVIVALLLEKPWPWPSC
ncbi:MAG: hypothetical protein D6788_06395 [Planctomycetota bacterium]|nr:MAG: hypothetical protein D6788_06395 [Planctomycetota bacterium]